MSTISVIIPIYNVERYLEQCIRSVMNQTFREIEIICVNDGSTDKSLDILNRLSLIDRRIKIISKSNSGYGHTMNIGLNHAKGKYISIVESDDYIEPTMLEELFKCAEEFSLELVKTNFFEFYNNKNIYFENLNGIIYEKILETEELAKLFFKAPSIWSGLYKRDFLINNKIVFNETQGASFQDTSFYCKTLLSGPKTMLLNSAYLHYRKDNVGSSMNSEKKMFCILDEFQEIRRFIKERNIINDKLIDAISYREYLTYKDKCDELAVPFKYAFVQKVSDFLRGGECQLLSTKIFLENEKKDYELMVNNPIEYIKNWIDYSDNRVSLNNSSMFCLNEEILVRAILDRIKETESVYVYGAGQVAKQVIAVVNKILQENKVSGVCVSELSSNKKKLDKYTLETLDTIENKQSVLYLIATSDQYQFEIMKRLKYNGCNNVISFNAELRHAFDKYLKNAESK